jgi:RND family efflux transporter MFP subunit
MKRGICSITAIWPAISVVTYLFLSACASKANKVEEKPETYKVISPTVIDTAYSKEYVAEIQSVQNVEIRGRVKGFIEKIYIDEGQPVKVGQVLFTLSSSEFREDLLKANAQLKSAMAELKEIEVQMKNTKELVGENIVSRSELETALAKKEAMEARIEEARSAISIAELNLSFTQVKAPFNGIINRIPNKTGSLVEDGTLLTTISNNSEVYAYFNVSEKEYLDFISRKQVGKSQKVSLLMANGVLFPHPGFIETTESEIDKSTGNLAFRARFSNPEQTLKHGSSGKILMSFDLRNALVIPQKSTFEVQDKLNVYIADAGNVIRMKTFTPKLRLPHLYVVESGLSPDDRIIYEGVQLVKDGEKIIPEPVHFNQMAAQMARQ